MLIDILCVLILGLGFYNGFRKGLIIVIFTVLAWIIGLIGALKFASVGAVYMRDKWDISSDYNPVISFTLIFIVIGLIVFLMGKVLEKMVDMAQLGIVNKMLGAILKTGTYLLLFSTLLWILNQAGIISPEAKTQSKLYSYVSPVAPFVINELGAWVPAFKNLLKDIQHYYYHFNLPEILK